MGDTRVQPRHPIRVVANRTGLTPTLLRAWERRYRVVAPGRTDAGQRLYSDADIERLTLLKQATEAGRGIGFVATLPLDALRELVDQDASVAASHAAPARDARFEEFTASAMSAIRAMDASQLEAELRRALVVFGVEAFTDDFLGPLLRGIGEGWSRGELRPAHEHLASAVVQRVLNWMLDTPIPRPGGPVAVMGTLSGEQHELGALLAAATAALEGWQVTFLGRDLPPADLALAAHTLDAQLVAVSSVYPVEGPKLEAQVRELRQALPHDIKLFVGGARAAELAPSVSDTGVRFAASLGEFREALREAAVPA